jgi:hypothetical protein
MQVACFPKTPHISMCGVSFHFSLNFQILIIISSSFYFYFCISLLHLYKVGNTAKRRCFFFFPKYLVHRTSTRMIKIRKSHKITNFLSPPNISHIFFTKNYFFNIGFLYLEVYTFKLNTNYILKQ